MPQLPTTVVEALDDPIMLEELQKAVGATKMGKSPRHDGLTIQYYKTLLPSIGQFMVNTFNVLGSRVFFPRETLQAHILLFIRKIRIPHPVTVTGQYLY